MPRKRQPISCLADPEPVCGQRTASDSRQNVPKEFSQKARRILNEQDVAVPLKEQERFIDHLFRSIRQRKVVAHKLSKNRKGDDIIGLIQMARDSGDLNEAIWRSFLAAHFGGASDIDNQIQSASQILCAFRTEPFWTWERVSRNEATFRKWLSDRPNKLMTLSFANHRKHESKQADGIWAVVKSFVDLAMEHRGPLGLISLDPPEPLEGFDLLYQRLLSLVRFGRLGVFDFLGLLLDLGLISVEPASCYLHGATGPLKGAKRLWGNHRRIGELEDLAADLAERLGISPMAPEDALCNWQK